MKKTAYIVISLLSLSLLKNVFAVAQYQSFNENYIPQIIITTPRAGSMCTVNTNYAAYSGQSVYFYSVLSEAKPNIFVKIINTATGQNGVGYTSNNPYYDSSKELIYNPFGALSNSSNLQAANTFIPNFFLESRIKPSTIPQIFVSRQYAKTHFVGSNNVKRNNPAGQIVHNIRKRSPSSLIENQGIEFKYVTYPDELTGSKKLSLSFISGNGRDRTDEGRYLCNTIYVARCGDGVVDKTTGDKKTDGQGGILPTASEDMIYWLSPTFTNEACDSGADNKDVDTPGACKADCSGFRPTSTSAGYCGDGIWDPDGIDNIEGNDDDELQCDLGEWDEATSSGNNDNYQLSECDTTCEKNTEPETFPEQLG